MQATPAILAQIRLAASKHGADPALVAAIVEVESGFDPAAVGDGGMSYGLMQLHLQGAGAGYSPEELLDVATNLDLGTAYLRHNLDHFAGDLAEKSAFLLRTAISAYNQGTAGAARRGWTFNRGYVEMVLAAMERWQAELSTGGQQPGEPSGEGRMPEPATPPEGGPDGSGGETVRLFSETGFAASGAFLAFFERYGLEVTGYPISEVVEMDGLPSQLWQRVIMEEYAPGQVRLKLVTDRWKEAMGKLGEIGRIVDGSYTTGGSGRSAGDRGAGAGEQGVGA